MEQLEELSESEIIERILKGEKSLYEIIVRRYNAYLYKTGRSYNYDHDDTLDLMQDSFVDAYKNLVQFEGRANFKTWLIRIMMNNCYRRRKKLSFKKEAMQQAKENSTTLIGGSSGTDKVVLNRELGHIIENALMKIPLTYRMVFSLREINGLNVSETAEMLKISEANVKVRLNRAKSLLKSKITEAYSATELYEFNLIYCDAMVENVMKKINEL